MRTLWFGMLLAWPLPGGGRITSIAYAKLFHLPTLEVLGVALLTCAFTAGMATCGIKLIRAHKIEWQYGQLTQILGQLEHHAWFRWLLKHFRATEAKYMCGARSHKTLLVQLPWCPGGLLSSVSLIARWRLNFWTALPIVLVSGWASFAVYYFAASFSYFALAAILIGPFLYRQAKQRGVFSAFSLKHQYLPNR